MIRSQPDPVQVSQTTLQQPEPVPVPNPNPNQSGNPGAMPVSGPPSTEYRKVVREELRELQEQQKRRSSLVIRGLGAGTASAAISAFEQVSQYLTNQKVTLTDVVRIPSESDLFRGKVTDDDARRLILEKSKQLKDAPRYGSVFIRRDLTFKQRSELKAKRDATVRTNSSTIPNSTIPPQPVGPAVTPPARTPEQHPSNGAHGHASVNGHDMVDTIPKRVDAPTPLSN